MDLKLQIFGAEDAENFLKIKVLKENWYFWSFKRKFGQIYDQHDDFKLICVLKWLFFDFEKILKISLEFWEIFSKNFLDLNGQILKIFEISFWKMQQNNNCWCT